MPRFIDEGYIEYESKRQKKQPPYRSKLHISPRSNIVERLLSRCGIIMRSHRRLKDPSALDMLVILRFKRYLWDERDVDIVITRNYGSELATSVTLLTPSSTLLCERNA